MFAQLVVCLDGETQLHLILRRAGGGEKLTGGQRLPSIVVQANTSVLWETTCFAHTTASRLLSSKAFPRAKSRLPGPRLAGAGVQCLGRAASAGMKPPASHPQQGRRWGWFHQTSRVCSQAPRTCPQEPPPQPWPPLTALPLRRTTIPTCPEQPSVTAVTGSPQHTGDTGHQSSPWSAGAGDAA